ncbi:hypothetical protein PsorP6_010534 [Peronosclerospora sorghi]|uniref:Uncharacterized protein n=1 Tax=Peronosclerospora sorghi TaxID=230839 RepID=A0ACC0VUL8_9STRA|nr:hypothetical protein PsorP6_010534 [Peronosclerospora sorghi]
MDRMFLRSHFFAGMTTTQRSESFKALCNVRLGSSTLLMEFVMEFDRIVKSRREARVKANYERKMRTIENLPYPLMARGYKCFSTYAFRKHALRVLLRHNVTAILERYILKRWRWDTLLLDNEGSAELGPAVSAEVSVAVRAQVSDNVAEVAGVVSEVAQVAAAAVSITVDEADSTPAPAAAFADI